MNRLGVALLTVSHAVDDLYQGAVPALLPFLVAERHYSYAAASGLVLAANVLASVAQPAFGAITDWLRLVWLIGAGMTVAGIGVGYALAIPSLVGLVTVARPWVLAFIVLTAVTTYLPFSLQVTLGQDYLPNRVGTASGVSLGLAITAGGLLAPLFGALADATSLRVTLTVLIALPVLALLLSTTMREPRHAGTAAGALTGTGRRGAARAE